jgi:hypothetical protein
MNYERVQEVTHGKTRDMVDRHFLIDSLDLSTKMCTSKTLLLRVADEMD